MAVELWAMQPAFGTGKTLVEYDPPVVPLRYLVCESMVILSGVTSVLPALPDQVKEILAAIEGTLTHAGTDRGDVVKLSGHLHRSQSLGGLRALLSALRARAPAEVDYGFVDGYSTEGKLIEIEITAQRSLEGQDLPLR